MSQTKLKIMLISKRLSSYPWGTGNFFHKSLVKLGHQIIDVDVDKHKDQLPQLAVMQQRYKADLLITLKGQGIAPDWVAAVKCPTVLWYQDDATEWQIARDDLSTYGPVYDHVYYFDDAGIELLKSLGIQNPKVLHCATDPETYTYQPNTEKIFDISFVGNVSPTRRQLLDRLQRKFRVHVATVFMHDMVNIFNMSKINFNLSVGKTGYPLRVFEALGMGGFLLTSDVPAKYRLFKDKTHLVYYNDDNVEDLVTYYLAHDKVRANIARLGYKEVMQKHTFDLRMKQLLKEVL